MRNRRRLADRQKAKEIVDQVKWMNPKKPDGSFDKEPGLHIWFLGLRDAFPRLKKTLLDPADAPYVFMGIYWRSLPRINYGKRNDLNYATSKLKRRFV